MPLSASTLFFTSKDILIILLYTKQQQKTHNTSGKGQLCFVGESKIIILELQVIVLRILKVPNTTYFVFFFIIIILYIEVGAAIYELLIRYFKYKEYDELD